MLTSGSKKRIVIVVDNAKYHHAKIVDEWIQSLNGKISLLFLPPYSPELNPIERVWKLVKRTAIHNKYFESLDELASIVEDLFWTWSSGHIVLARLCA
jgi:transposase